MSTKAIKTEKAPLAIGPYSQAIQTGNLLFLSGQIALDPATLALVPGGFAKELPQVFRNMEAIILAAGGELAQIVKLTVYLQNLNDFSTLNEMMLQYLKEPYPARTTIAVAALPRGAALEIEAIISL